MAMIREGLLYQYGMTARQKISDVLDFSIDNILLKYDLDKQHAKKVYSLTREMFVQLQAAEILDADLENIIKAGTMLHDAGLAVGYYGNRNFVFDVILNSEINGLSHRELVMSAFIASFDFSEISEADRRSFSRLLKAKDWQTISQIGILLRIAGKLDRSMYGIVQGVTCSQDAKDVTIKICSAANPRFEVKSAETYSDLFKKIYGKSLKFIYGSAKRSMLRDH